MRSDLSLVITKAQWFWQQEKRLCSGQSTAVKIVVTFETSKAEPSLSLFFQGATLGVFG